MNQIAEIRHATSVLPHHEGGPFLHIPYIDLVGQHAILKQELLSAIEIVIDSGQFILSKAVARFERDFARLCGVQHAIGVASGTDGLILSLRSLGIGPNDEVITAPNSFVASATCIAAVGARPVFADVKDDYLIDPESIRKAITARTRAIIPVHLTGRPCDMDAIYRIADQHGLYVVEDAAQAVSAELGSKPVGSLGDLGCFSLHPLKTLNACGDAGIVTTDDDELAEKLRLLRNLGLRTREDCVVWSPNSRLDSIQAAMLQVKLRYLDEWTERRRANARHYMQRLSGVPQVTTPSDAPGVHSVYHTFVIQAERRDELKQYLQSQGIDTAVHYAVPIHLQTVGRELGYAEGDFPVAEEQSRRILSLPVYPELTSEQLDDVCDAILEFYASDANTEPTGSISQRAHYVSN